MTSVQMSTHFRDLVVGPAAMHAQDGHQLVRSIPSQCKQPTVVGAREDLRVTLLLCTYRVCYEKLFFCLFVFFCFLFFIVIIVVYLNFCCMTLIATTFVHNHWICAPLVTDSWLLDFINSLCWMSNSQNKLRCECFLSPQLQILLHWQLHLCMTHLEVYWRLRVKQQRGWVVNFSNVCAPFLIAVCIFGNEEITGCYCCPDNNEIPMQKDW